MLILLEVFCVMGDEFGENYRDRDLVVLILLKVF